MADYYTQTQFKQAVFDRTQDREVAVESRVDPGATKDQRLRWPTVMCLILNRTIGSGIFVAPAKTLAGTGSVGGSLFMWTFGGLIEICLTAVWLEFSLSVPLYRVEDVDNLRSVPRSGGEKNYIEFVYRKFPFLATCMYGIPFVILGNLAGNAIAFGMYFMDLLGYPNAGKGPIIGAAVTVLTVSVLIHMFSRRGGIMLNNSFAIIKVFILLTIIILGFIKASGNRLGGDERATDNFNPNISFSTDRKGIAALPDYVTSLLYVTYTYSGFEQPFYALTECANPRKMFPWATMTAMALATFLFVLVNIAYLCAVPKDVQLANIDETMATIFFQRMFGDSREAQRGMAALAAFSIFGNLIVMTFTASRVKQEIAKEGILPFSLFFASSSTSLWARFQSRFLSTQGGQDPDHPEQTPIAALGLHLLTSCLLIAVTSMLDPSDAYSILVPLYSYVMVIMVAFFVSAGLLYLKFSPLPTSAEGQQDSARMEWSQRSEEDRFRPWLDPVPTIICFVVCGFLLFASFDKLSDSSPFANTQGKIPWYLVPTVGFSTLLGGFIWWLGLKLRMAQRKETLVVDRVPWIEQEDPDTDFWIQKGEFVRHHWRPN